MKINLLAIVIGIILIAAIAWFFLKPSSTITSYCTLPIKKEKVIFAYYDGCPACASVKPIMEKRNDVYWLNVLDENCQKVMKELNLEIRAVPTFICVKDTRIQIVGVRSEDEINEWIKNNC